MHDYFRKVIASWVAVFLVLPVPVYAAIDEIVVTVRKSEERLQDVPVAVTAFGAEMIEDARIESLDDVASMTPGLNFFNPIGDNLPVPVIRGVAPTDIFGETNAAVFIDGVYAAGREGLNFSMLDVERIEVIKGPQSALYGRNAFSGAINYVTKRPPNEFASTVEVTAGDRGRQGVKARVGGPLIDDFLSASIGAGYDTWDGSYDNPISDVDVGGYEHRTFSIGLDWTPTDSFSALLNGYYSDDELDEPPLTAQLANCENVGPDDEAGLRYANLCGEVADLDQIGDVYNQGIVGNPNVPAELQFVTGDEQIARIAESKGEDRQVSRASLKLDWDIGGGNLTALTGYSRLVHKALMDGGEGIGYAQPFVYCEDILPIYADAPNNTVPLCVDSATPQRFTSGTLVVSPEDTAREMSQEIRFTGPQDRPVRYSFGGYAFNFELDEVSATVLARAPSLPPGLGDPTGPGELPPGAAFGPYLNGAWAIGDPAFRPWFTPTSTLGGDPFSTAKTRSYAAFGTLDWDISDQLTADFQLRYTSETKSINAFSPRLASSEKVKKEFTFTTGKAGLRYTFSEDWMLYGSISNGVKAGGFDVEEVDVLDSDTGFSEERIVIVTYDEEKILAYELGLKGTTADGRLRLDLSLYRMNWDDIIIPQIFEYDPVSGDPLEQPEGFNTNAGDATVTGWEAQGDISFTDNWYSGFGVSYTDATMDDAKLSSFANLPSFAPDGDVSGNQLLRQPEWQANANVRYVHELNEGWELNARADIVYQDKYFGGLDNQWTVPSHTYVNLKLGLESDKWAVSLWAKNVFNDNSPVAGFRNVYFGNTDDIFQQQPAASSPQKFFPWRISTTHPKLRTIGMTVKVRFGATQ